MIDWSRSMKQTYRYYKVDPISWLDKEPIDIVKSCSITRDLSVESLGSGEFVLGELLNECYIRVYLEISQDGNVDTFPLGTLLAIPTSRSFNGKTWSINMDGYTPLIELKEKYPEIGYTAMAEQNILELVNQQTRIYTRAPIIEAKDEMAVIYEDYIADTDDTWLSYQTDLLNVVKYRFDLDEYGQILLAPLQDLDALQPRASFNDSNSSILLPTISEEDDIFNIPNTVEVIYSNSSSCLISRIVNDDPNSPTSTISRGREILYRDTSPSIKGNPTQQQLDEYAEQLLKSLSTIQRTITFSHAYKPVRPGDAVLLNYSRAGIQNVKAVITRQTINCEKACTIQETVAYTKKLWK